MTASTVKTEKIRASVFNLDQIPEAPPLITEPTNVIGENALL